MVWASVWPIVGCVGVGSRGSRSCRVASQGVARWEVGWETASSSHEIQSLKPKKTILQNSHYELLEKHLWNIDLSKPFWCNSPEELLRELRVLGKSADCMVCQVRWHGVGVVE